MNTHVPPRQLLVNKSASLDTSNQPIARLQNRIGRTYRFESAHHLPLVPEGHKCKNMHGHTYRLRVLLEGDPDPQFGWVMDFAELKAIMQPVLDKIDHKLMNELPGLENPTCEHIAIWLWNQLKPSLPKLTRIELHETPTTGAIYEGV